MFSHSVVSRQSELLVFVEEIVIGCVRHELSLAHSARGRRGRSSICVQTLDESYLIQESPARRALIVPNGLQQEAGYGSGVRAALAICAGLDRCSHCFSPHPATVKGTLPGSVASQGYWFCDVIVRIFIDAEEMGDDLDGQSEDIGKECSLGPSRIYGPGSSA